MNKVTELVRTYISGPIRKCSLEERQKAFEAVELMILNRHEVPVNPMKNGLGLEVSEYMHMAIDLGLIRTCQKIIMMPYWQGSVGAQEELDYAESLGLQVEFMSKVNVPNPYQKGSYDPFKTNNSEYL